MILVDTSVWVDYFNGSVDEQTNRLDNALENDLVAMADLIFLEILQGFRSDRDYIKAKNTLSGLGQFEMLGTYLALKSADNDRFLRKHGITVRKTADVIIATFCTTYDIPLLFSDRDFDPFVDKLGLVPALGV